MNFLNAECHCGGIITNPPFNLAAEFIERSAAKNIPFAMLTKATFWHAKKRQKLFEATRPMADHSHDVEASHVTRAGQERHYGFHLDRLGICPIKDRPNTFYKERTVTKNTEVQKLQSKIAVQRNEIARLTQLVQKLMEQRDQLTKDLKWMRGEK